MSQGYDVLQPRTGRAYPVPCEEWDLLKGRLRQVSTPPWVYQTVGSLLGGTAITTLVTILIGPFPPLSKSNALVIAWAAVAVSTICAAVCFFFGHQQRKMQSVHVADVITQMEIIERRYERSDTGTSRAGSQATLTILSARYGATGKYVDVTQVVAQSVDASGLHVVAGNQLAGDPCPMTLKELVVEYEHNGQRLSKTVKESETLSIP
jgi:hypothetical protein